MVVIIVMCIIVIDVMHLYIFFSPLFVPKNKIKTFNLIFYFIA
jgi:hypothetical protein